MCFNSLEGKKVYFTQLNFKTKTVWLKFSEVKLLLVMERF